ncbi:MAG TPA: hypothetical protein VF189_02245 [Patescibacteria group bacterium]
MNLENKPLPQLLLPRLREEEMYGPLDVAQNSEALALNRIKSSQNIADIYDIINRFTPTFYAGAKTLYREKSTRRVDIRDSVLFGRYDSHSAKWEDEKSGVLYPKSEVRLGFHPHLIGKDITLDKARVEKYGGAKCLVELAMRGSKGKLRYLTVQVYSHDHTKGSLKDDDLAEVVGKDTALFKFFSSTPFSDEGARVLTFYFPRKKDQPLRARIMRQYDETKLKFSEDEDRFVEEKPEDKSFFENENTFSSEVAKNIITEALELFPQEK